MIKRHKKMIKSGKNLYQFYQFCYFT
ncbi:KxYKxGKxW signal peptide domain-containing protein [uncultured Mucilaginibacter sp.]